MTLSWLLIFCCCWKKCIFCHEHNVMPTRHFDVICDNPGIDVAPYSLSYQKLQLSWKNRTFLKFFSILAPKCLNIFTMLGPKFLKIFRILGPKFLKYFSILGPKCLNIFIISGPKFLKNFRNLGPNFLKNFSIFRPKCGGGIQFSPLGSVFSDSAPLFEVAIIGSGLSFIRCIKWGVHIYVFLVIWLMEVKSCLPHAAWIHRFAFAVYSFSWFRNQSSIPSFMVPSFANGIKSVPGGSLSGYRLYDLHTP